MDSTQGLGAAMEASAARSAANKTEERLDRISADVAALSDLIGDLALMVHKLEKELRT